MVFVLDSESVLTHTDYRVVVIIISQIKNSHLKVFTAAWTFMSVLINLVIDLQNFCTLNSDHDSAPLENIGTKKSKRLRKWVTEIKIYMS